MSHFIKKCSCGTILAQCRCVSPNRTETIIEKGCLACQAGIPRRARLNLFSSAEKAIWDATQEVEKMGADVRLTDAVILLGQAREKVADYIDGKE